MILQTCLLLTLSVAWGALGASYSNVFVQTGPDPAVPAAVEYYGYPYNFEYGSPQLAQYKTPVKYDYPFGSGSYSYRTASALAEPVAAVAAPPSTSVVYPAYTPAISNLYGARSEPNGYEYAYVVLPNSGADLRQLNEGEVLRGGYTFVQPGGLVQYLADNNQGLNAIIKNYLPGEDVTHSETAHHDPPHHETAHHETTHRTPAQNSAPCHNAKSAALKENEGHHEHHDEDPEERHGGHEHEIHVELVEHEAHPAEHEGRHADHEAQPAEHEPHHEEHEAHDAENEARHGGHEAAKPHDDHESHGDDSSHHEHNIIIKIHEGHDSDNDEPKVEIEHHVHAHEHDEPHGAEKTHSHDSDEHKHTHESIVEDPHKGHETAIAVAPEYPAVGNNVFISYNDFIKCIQAALARGNTHPYYPPAPKPAVSPLTYLIYNKPC